MKKHDDLVIGGQGRSAEELVFNATVVLSCFSCGALLMAGIAVAAAIAAIHALVIA